MFIRLIAAAVGGGFIVNLAGEAISHAHPTDSTAGIRFNLDGTIDELRGTSYSQIDAATDWIIPNGKAATDFEVRFTGLTGDAFTTEAASSGTWIALSLAREWKLNNIVDLTTDSNSVTFEIRRGSGATIDTGVYTFSAQVT